MADIFISYSKQNIDFARHLRHLLQDEGFSVWMDETQLEASERWWPTIEANIMACSAFIVIMSPESKASDWVEREILLAEDREYRKPIFPILLSGKMWPRLANIQYEDMRAGLNARLSSRFVTKLAGITKRSGVTNSTHSPPEESPPPNPLPTAWRGEKRNAPAPARLPRNAWIGLGVVLVGVVVMIALLASKNPSVSVTLTPLLSGTDYDLTANAEMNNILTDTAAAATAKAVGTSAQWTKTPTPDARQTALARLTETATLWTPTPTALGGGSGEIAFYSKRDGNWQIYVMEADGSNPRRLINNSADDEMPAWSPDGSQIAFVSLRDGNFEIYVMNADGSNPRNLTNTSVDGYMPVWSPDGSQIAFVSLRDGNFEIYVMNADGSNPRNLTNNNAYDYRPVWSPDGRQIAFSSDRDGNSEIYVMEADGSSPRRLMNNNSIDSSPVWSPDGRQIAFDSDRDGNSEIYVMEADGSNPRRLTNGSADSWSPDWSPDGHQIAFQSNRDGNWEIYMMEADGSNPRRLTNTSADDYGPKWRPVVGG